MNSVLGRIMSMAVLMSMTSFSGAAETETAARKADHEALRALLVDISSAINEKRFDDLVACFSKEFAFTTVDQVVLKDVQGIENYYEKLIGKDSPVSECRIEPRAEELSRFTGQNTAYCYGTSDDTYTLRRNGRSVHMTSRWTATLVKEDGQWKVAAVHAGISPLDNPVLKIRTMPLWRKLLLAIGIGKYPGEK